MSIFDYPRINVKGLIAINVGTANNDDYSGYQFPTGSKFAGQPMRLCDSQNVQPIMYNMDDDEWVKWVQQTVDVYEPPQDVKLKKVPPRFEGAPSNGQVIPSEWNYYGDMGATMMNVNVTGINDPNSQIPASLLTQLQSSQLSFLNRLGPNGRNTGMVIDVNSEDPTNTQMFADTMSLMTSSEVLFSGKPSKGMTRWINFARNANLTGPNGAAATFQQIVPLSELQGQPILAGLPQKSPLGRPLAGIVCRYTLYRPLQEINYFAPQYQGQGWFNAMIQLYSTQGINPDYLTLQGTIAPWFEGDATSQPIGRYLEPIAFPTPKDFKGNSGPGLPMRVPPAMMAIDAKQQVLSIDCSAVWPDYYAGAPAYNPLATDDNPKYPFGTMSVSVVANGIRTSLGDIDYMNMAKNDANGWIFDLPLTATTGDMVATGVVSVKCYSDTINQYILQEKDLFIFSEQSGVYAEQVVGNLNPTTGRFRYDGIDTTPISFTVYRKGLPLPPDDPMRFTLYYWETTPNQNDGQQRFTILQTDYQAGAPITFPAGKCGNFLITCTPQNDPPPPDLYSNFDPLTGCYINIRILPNYKDYSEFYKDPNAAIPVGNDKLTFEVIYEEVLRNYYLMYPAMSKVVKLNDPKAWNDPVMARMLMQRISLEVWGQSIAMPRTRDLSDSRRTLLNAWCLKIINA
ncbi:hypothetical protein [Chitinophaga barathri]|uniref:Uncharacterized protein n=1 Tax=Chitinophaga barathri TaxID=1647451 RepID=A0A3N4MF58_9BACT|nr:hypothetical protein [Chitinophaga barathri]RPD38279.1 hypothetical protein EG028_25645 [Chitinophaga barathri]